MHDLNFPVSQKTNPNLSDEIGAAAAVTAVTVLMVLSVEIANQVSKH